MTRQIGQRLTAFLRQLFEAQGTLCFHCDEPMLAAVPRGGDRRQGWTREHVYPRATGGNTLGNNIVLAHASCNNDKGSRDPTQAEIEKAIGIYASLGLTAFIPGAITVMMAEVEFGHRRIHAPQLGISSNRGRGRI